MGIGNDGSSFVQFRRFDSFSFLFYEVARRRHFRVVYWFSTLRIIGRMQSYLPQTSKSLKSEDLFVICVIIWAPTRVAFRSREQLSEKCFRHGSPQHPRFVSRVWGWIIVQYRNTFPKFGSIWCSTAKIRQIHDHTSIQMQGIMVPL